MKLVAIAFAAVVAAHSADAQEPLAAPAPPEDAWGTSLTTVTTLGSYSFVGPLADAADFFRICGASGTCRASVSVPTGMRPWNVEIEGCDTSPVREGVARLWECSGTCRVLHETRTGVANAGGCARYRADVPHYTIYNYSYSYFVELFGTDGVSNVPFEFRAVRVSSLRQVSPPSGTPTFSDVPTNHPFHRYVEALADSHITGGCGGGLFCPDRPVTRAEMAAFLSIALGLNFPD